MASFAHELDVCFLHGGDDNHGEYLRPLLVIEESDDDCTPGGPTGVPHSST